jgi:hypothetical protein
MEKNWVSKGMEALICTGVQPCVEGGCTLSNTDIAASICGRSGMSFELKGVCVSTHLRTKRVVEEFFEG